MDIRAGDIEDFLRQTVDSSIRVQQVIGLDLGAKGVAFQYQSPSQTIWIVLEYTTAASLILAPLYAPIEDVESIVARETFQDAQLDKLGELHHAFLLWLKEQVDDQLEPTDGRFFSSSEPIPETMSRHLHSVEPFASMVSLLGYPEGALHLFMGLPPDGYVLKEDVAVPTTESIVVSDAEPPEDSDYDLVGDGNVEFSSVFDRLLQGLVVVGTLVLLWFGWGLVEVQQGVVETVNVIQGSQNTDQTRAHQVRIPGGPFIMGCTMEECAEDEAPHRVTVSRDFFMLESEVTQEQYKALMGGNPSHNYQCGGDCPVDSVTWEQAIEYANRLSKQDGYDACYTKTNDQWTWERSCLGWRLPTEAEWERAALGIRNSKQDSTDAVKIVPIEKTAWHVDEGVLKHLPIVLGTDSTKQQELLRLFVESHPVCNKARNGYGLCDMSGNVWEWVWDWYEPDMSVKTHNSVDPRGPELGRSKVLKGGAFHSYLKDIHPHRRIHLAPWATMGEVRFETGKGKDSIEVFKGAVGFRLVRTASE